MSFRFSHLATGVVVVAVVLMSSQSWAYFYELGPSKNEWGLKFDGEVTVAAADKLNVRFTLADAGRLNPIYSASVLAFSNPGPDGARSYLVNARIDLQPTPDGKLTGQVQIDRRFANRAVVRILTQTFDGRFQTAGARYYDIPLWRFMKKAPGSAPPQPAPPSIASPPASNVRK